jgi:hypothetical protein
VKLLRIIATRGVGKESERIVGSAVENRWISGGGSLEDQHDDDGFYEARISTKAEGGYFSKEGRSAARSLLRTL